MNCRQNEDAGRTFFHCVGTVNGISHGLPSKRYDSWYAEEEEEDEDDDEEEVEARKLKFERKRSTSHVFSNAIAKFNVTLSNFAKLGKAAERKAMVGRCI